MSTTGQNAIETWDFASLISGFDSAVRLVARGRRVDPIYPLHVVSTQDDSGLFSIRLHRGFDHCSSVESPHYYSKGLLTISHLPSNFPTT